MAHKIFHTVNALLEQYVGGQIFFTELDRAVKFDKEVLAELIIKANELTNNKALTIASGEIGLSMHNLGIMIDFLVPGGLRHDPSKINLAPFQEYIKGKSFLFIDDSYFSGKTVTVVKEEIERLGGTFLGTLVAYDGSRYKDENVHSLYRYYDYYDILGRPLKGE